MEEWKEYKLEEVGKITTGKTPKTAIKEFFEGNILFVTPADINTPYKYVYSTARYLSEEGLSSISSNSIEKGSICVSCIGNIGYVGIVDMKCASNQQINSITVSQEHDRDFVYYAIKNLWPYFKNYEGQSTTLSILNKGQFSKIVIKAPQKEIQQRIASILSSLDDKIELNRRTNNNLDQQTLSLFNSWLEKSKTDDYCLSDIAEFISGYSYKSDELKESRIAMATIKNFDRRGGFKLAGFKEIIPSGKLKECQTANIFDILVAHTDLTQNAEVIGNAELLMSLGGYEQIVFSMDLVKVVPKKSFPYRFVLASLLRSKTFKSHSLGYVNGTTVLHLSKKGLQEYKFLMTTNTSEIAKMDKILGDLYRRQSHIIEENIVLVKLRDALLPRLMSGEIDVKDIEHSL